MSRFVKNSELVFKDIKILQKAMEAMGYGLTFSQEQELKLKGFYGETKRVSALVDFHKSVQYDIGFVQENGAYQCVADWWGVNNEQRLNEKPFLVETMKNYAFIAAKETAPYGFTEQRRHETEEEYVLELTSY